MPCCREAGAARYGAGSVSSGSIVGRDGNNLTALWSGGSRATPVALPGSGRHHGRPGRGDPQTVMPPNASGCSSTRRSTPPAPRRATRTCWSPSASLSTAAAGAASTPITDRARGSPMSCSICAGAGPDVRRYVCDLENWLIRSPGGLQRGRRASRLGASASGSTGGAWEGLGGA